MPALSSDETAPRTSDLSTSPPDHISPKAQEKPLKSALAGVNGIIIDRNNPDERAESPRTVNGVKNNASGSMLPNGNLPVSIIAGRERSHSKAGSTYSVGSARSVRFSFQEERHTKARSQEFLPNGYINGVQRESPLKPKEMANSEYFTIEEDGPSRNAEGQHDLPSSNASHLPSHRFSSPPAILSSTGHETSATSLPSLLQRHPLQPPKLTTKTNRPSRDFSFSAGQSDEAIAGPARHSPVTAETRNRRASLGLIRRNTKPVQPDGNLDEYPPDEDALRWTEAIKAKRASRRRRKDDEDDDRVIVGTKVDQNHVNYVTAYNMLTGIRFTVSRTNAKMDRELTDADFTARHKFSFDITGNELTPSAKYDFKFKDYAPWVFRHLRSIFKLDPADYLVSLTSKYILSELGSPGKSGSFFYFSRDYKYIIKTIHHAEHKLLRKVLREYYNHVVDNPHTLVSQFYGLHRVKIAFGRKIHFVVMNNLFPPHRDIHQMFDLKGSTIGRDFKEEDLAKNPRATLKDLNWLRRDMHLELGQGKREAFIEQMKRDVKLLQRLHIMDYSLLVGIHDLEKGNEQGLREKNLKVFQPGGERADGEMKSMLTRTASRQENQRKVKELRQTLKNEKPVPMEMVQSKMPDKMVVDDRRDRIFYSDDGGFQATYENGEPAEMIYYLGIIDCLTHYGFVKRLEHFWKGLSQPSTQISPVPPWDYGERFINFMTGITMTEEVAQRKATQTSETAISPTEEQTGATTSLEAFRSSSQSDHHPRSPVERTMDKAFKQADKSERRSSSEQALPDRTLAIKRSASAERTNGAAGTTLPVVEEAGESGSTGGRSGSFGPENSNIADKDEKTQGRVGLDKAGRDTITVIRNSTEADHERQDRSSVPVLPPVVVSPLAIDPEKRLA